MTLIIFDSQFLVEIKIKAMFHDWNFNFVSRSEAVNNLVGDVCTKDKFDNNERMVILTEESWGDEESRDGDGGLWVDRSSHEQGSPSR